eukprot:1161717-Pelagomonas_calceolata.AAC.2
MPIKKAFAPAERPKGHRHLLVERPCWVRAHLLGESAPAGVHGRLPQLVVSCYCPQSARPPLCLPRQYQTAADVDTAVTPSSSTQVLPARADAGDDEDDARPLKRCTPDETLSDDGLTPLMAAKWLFISRSCSTIALRERAPEALASCSCCMCCMVGRRANETSKQGCCTLLLGEGEHEKQVSEGVRQTKAVGTTCDRNRALAADASYNAANEVSK